MKFIHNRNRMSDSHQYILEITDDERLKVQRGVLHRVIDLENSNYIADKLFGLALLVNYLERIKEKEQRGVEKEVPTTKGDRLKYLLRENNMTQEELAEKIGMHRTQISNLCRNMCEMTKPFILLMSYMFHINVEWLEKGELPFEREEN